MGQVSYARWRSAQLKAVPGMWLPDVRPDRWQLVLFVMKPSSVSGFLRTGKTRDLLSAPTVGQFSAAVEPRDALSATLAGWIEQFPGGPHRLAPPILQVGRHLEVVDFDIQWSLPATESVLLRAKRRSV